MKTFGNNSHGGKRSSSSYSSWCSTAAILIFVSLCGFAIYTLTSSSSTSLLSFSHSSPAADHRFLLKDIQPPLDESEVEFGNSEQDSSQNPNGEKREDENESREQKKLEKEMDEDRENENRPRLQLEDSEDLAKTLIGEQSKIKDFDWDPCNVSAGPDYIPCLDNAEAIRKLKSFKH